MDVRTYITVIMLKIDLPLRELQEVLSGSVQILWVQGEKKGIDEWCGEVWANLPLSFFYCAHTHWHQSQAQPVSQLSTIASYQRQALIPSNHNYKAQSLHPERDPAR